MALKSPLVPSPGGAMSSVFSPYTDSSTTPPLSKSPRFVIMSPRDSSAPLRPHSSYQPPSRSLSLPFETTDPSPITSDKTDIDDSGAEDEETRRHGEAEVAENEEEEQAKDKPVDAPAPNLERPPDARQSSEKTVIDTSVPPRPRSTSSETPQSVIHAPEGFREFLQRRTSIDLQKGSDHDPVERVSPRSAKTPSPTPLSQVSQISSELARQISAARQSPSRPASPPPISTAVDSASYSLEDATPRANTRQEVEALVSERSWRQRTSSLEDIPEAQYSEHEDIDPEDDEDDESAAVLKGQRLLQASEEEIKALQTALSECWTLCNTLAGLSSIHRQRIFHLNSSSASDAQQEEQAWKSCWKLCQKLYESRDGGRDDAHVTPILDLCRDFCQALFDVRQRASDLSDSVLRVSFELNNHLYNTHDRSLPEAFRERTLDFYVTLCHRLMKQRTRLAGETDALLRTCWSLAEMLFSLRQSRREGKPPDEELLGSAVQACWDLCDLFREGWTQVRPERGTPRPTQMAFAKAGGGALTNTTNTTTTATNTATDAATSAAASSTVKQHSVNTINGRRTEPETPTTIFEDMALSPDGEDARVPPNILVLGTDTMVPGAGAIGIGLTSAIGGGVAGAAVMPAGAAAAQRWSSSASTLSDFSQSSVGTSSTITTKTTTAAAAGNPSNNSSTGGSRSSNVDVDDSSSGDVSGGGGGGGGNNSSSIASSSDGGGRMAAHQDSHLNRLKMLILKAAMNSGFQRASGQTLHAFGKCLTRTSFGRAPWQMDLLEHYQHMLLTDAAFRTPVALPPRRVSAPDMARAVEWVVRGGQYAFLADLYRLVFGFPTSEAAQKSHVLIQT